MKQIYGDWIITFLTIVIHCHRVCVNACVCEERVAWFFVFPAILPEIFRCLLQTHQFRGLCRYYSHFSSCISRKRVECSIAVVTVGISCLLVHIICRMNTDLNQQKVMK